MMGKTRRHRCPQPSIEADRRTIRADFLVKCGAEARKLLKLVKQKEFTTDLKLQKQAALLFRGIHMKMRSLDACAEIRDQANLPGFMDIIQELRGEYSQVFNRIPIDVTTDGRPMIIEIERQGDHQPTDTDKEG